MSPRPSFGYQRWYNFIWTRFVWPSPWSFAAVGWFPVRAPFFRLNCIFAGADCMHNNMAVARTGSPSCTALNLCQNAASQRCSCSCSRRSSSSWSCCCPHWYNGLNEKDRMKADGISEYKPICNLSTCSVSKREFKVGFKTKRLIA